MSNIETTDVSTIGSAEQSQDLLQQAQNQLSEMEGGHQAPPRPSGENPNEKPKDNDLSSRYAQIAHKDRLLSKRERDLNDRERLFNEREGGLQTKYSKFEGVEDLKNPMDVLKRYNFTLDDVLDQSLGDDSGSYEREQPRENSEVAQLRELVEKLSGKFDESQNTLKERDEKSQLSVAKGHIQRAIGENAEKYEVLNYHGQEGVDYVHHLMATYKKENGVDIPFQTAADYAEKQLEQKLSGLSKLSKFGGRKDNVGQENSPNAPSENNMGAQNQPYQPQQQRQTSNDTLSNDQHSSGFTDHGYEDEEELFKRAAGLLKFTD